MAGMKIIHGCKPPPEASRRHGYIHAVRKVFLDFFCGVKDSVSGHGAILREKLLPVLTQVKDVSVAQS
jgi:hypothetical protein